MTLVSVMPHQRLLAPRPCRTCVKWIRETHGRKPPLIDGWPADTSGRSKWLGRKNASNLPGSSGSKTKKIEIMPIALLTCHRLFHMAFPCLSHSGFFFVLIPHNLMGVVSNLPHSVYSLHKTGSCFDECRKVDATSSAQ